MSTFDGVKLSKDEYNKINKFSEICFQYDHDEEDTWHEIDINNRTFDINIFTDDSENVTTCYAYEVFKTCNGYNETDTSKSAFIWELHNE
tara:strand:- start:38 stop:307 length:270 start_codon:yes stop_codon:yes gene_type:complete